MNCRAQQTVLLFVIMEITLLIGTTIGIFTLIDRAADSKTPAQHYLARELAFTKDAIDIYAGANVYYEFYSLASKEIKTNSQPFVMGFAAGKAIVGTEKSVYHPDQSLPEVTHDSSDPSLALQIAGGTFYADPARTTRHVLDVPCGKLTVPSSIALVPVTGDGLVIASLLASQSKKFSPESGRMAEMLTNPQFNVQTVAQADAIIFIETVSDQVYKAYASDRLFGCTLLNAITPDASFEVLGQPNQKVDLPLTALLPLSFPKPAVRLVVGVPAGTDEQRIAFLKSVADQLGGVLQ
ncbi:hypothetical protein HY492_00305 [Candidatus Woesearchaeota archaeon]|nr:hypothetical protein [Candidatus Woesearchaeota archaeon]